MANRLTDDMNATGCRGCCIYPNSRPFGITAFVLSIISFILAVYALFSCTYFGFSGFTDQLGFFSARTSSTSSCVDYSSGVVFPSSWKFAKAMAIIGIIVSCFAFIVALCLPCMSLPNLALKLTAIMYLIAALCIILTLVAKAGCVELIGIECDLGPGAILAIITPLLYLVMAGLFFKMPLYEPSDADAAPVAAAAATSGTQEAKGTVTTSVTELPDGSKKTVTTTIDEHGNKTIEETIEAPQAVQETPEEEVVTTVLPDGSIKTTRTYIDADGSKVIEETIEEATA